MDDVLLRMDPHGLETRLFGLSSDLPPETLQGDVQAIEESLRLVYEEFVRLDRMGAPLRKNRLEHLGRARWTAHGILDGPDFALSRAESGVQTSWAEQIAAFLQQLLNVDIPGWASRGSEAVLASVLIGGAVLLLRFLRRRNPAAPIGGGIREQGTEAIEDPAVPHGALEAAWDSGDARAVAGVACRLAVARLARDYGFARTGGAPHAAPARQRLEALTHRELLMRWRASGRMPATECSAAGELFDLHENAFYGDQVPADAVPRLRRLVAALVHEAARGGNRP
jgi:hypothetical protein